MILCAMALPVNIEDLLSKRKVESERIEFKSGWNATAIYRSVCAFANDFDNLGGGYILVGVEEEEGVAKRPVKGVSTTEIDRISKQMVNFDKKIRPFYAARTSVEEIDGKYVFVIWVPSGVNRPYQVPRDIAAGKDTLSPYEFYIRRGSNSVIADAETQRELFQMADHTPFDDRGNPAIRISDISATLLRDYLVRVGSKLADSMESLSVERILEQMDLLYGPSENRMVKNVAAMMFCDTPDKFFKNTQVEVVIFPEGRERNPDNMREIPPFRGCVPQIIRTTLEYLRNHVIQEAIIKQSDKAESLRFFNYPYQAFEEAVVNALYHRDYTQREPVEITIEPERVSILSYAGPDRSISMQAIREGKSLRSRRYRNRQLGVFLKELGLTEGRATGIPTIQLKLAQNGSLAAHIETDDERSYFLIDIPCHSHFSERNSSFVSGEDKAERLEQLSKVIKKFLIAHYKQVEENATDACPKSVPSLSQEEEWHLAAFILEQTATPHSARELMQLSSQTNRSRMVNRYLKPLIQAGLVQLTLPNSPQSSKQKYVLTPTGAKLLQSAK